MTRQIVPIFVCAAFLFLGGCATSGKQKQADQRADSAPMQADAKTAHKSAVAIIKPSAAATTQPTNNDVRGTVTFTRGDNAVKVVADISGLAPNTKHGFHIHEKGDLSAPDLASAGAHYNPMGMRHGGPPPTGQMTLNPRHMGDLGNLTADAQGNAHLETTVPSASLSGEHSLIGRSVIVHAKEDDLKTDPSGNSGGRIAGGVIELKE
jgi:Cu-Zn family superoxide dismutase